MNILLVDDDENSRIFLKRTLTKKGHSVSTASNGVQALERARHQPPDIIISDILMPEMDGFELCRRVKADEQLRTAPFVFYTATFVDQKDEKLGMALGASRFIIKPLEIDDFLKAIEEVLKQHEEKKLPAPEKTEESEEGLELMYSRILSEKLEKKVRELEEERRALQKSEQKYRRLVENLREEYLFYSHGTDGVFTYVSPSITDVLGYTQQEFLKHYTEYLTPNPINKKVKQYSELSIKGESQRPYEIEIYHKDRSVRLMEIREVPVFDEQGNVYAVEGIARDITERKKAENLLKLTLNEKEILLREIHHRVKNNMQIISSLLSLQLHRIKDTKYQELFRDSRNRIRAMALVHENLYRSVNLDRIDLNDYIKTLAGNLVKSYNISASRVSLKTDIDDISLSIDAAIPCGLIINELFTNSLRHAFPADRKGEISISFNQNNAGERAEYILTVKDNGVGIPDDVDFEKLESLGLQLVKDITKHQLRGELTLDRIEGTEFRIRFRDPSYKKRM